MFFSHMHEVKVQDENYTGKPFNKKASLASGFERVFYHEVSVTQRATFPSENPNEFCDR